MNNNMTPDKRVCEAENLYAKFVEVAKRGQHPISKVGVTAMLAELADLRQRITEVEHMLDGGAS